MKISIKQTVKTIAVTAALVTAPLAQATNGYFTIGAGAKNRSMAGAGIAFGQDALASALNPATLAGIGTRVDGGVEIFNPQREATVDASGMVTPDLDGPGPATSLSGIKSNANSGATLFAVPNIGFTKDFGNGLTAGLAITANGGMNTRYNTNLYTNAVAPVIGQSSNNNFPTPQSPPGPSGFAGLLETGFGVNPNTIDAAMGQLLSNPNLGPSLGVNLAQLLFAPTIAYQITQNHSVGFAPVIGYQRFRAYGLGIFAGFSSDPANLTNKGDDDAWGIGGRIGYQGKFGPVSFGATATSKIYMQEFDNYAGLFAEQGDFDIPATYGVGLAIEVTPKITFAADVSRILYGDVNAIANDGPTGDEFFSGFAFALSGGTAPGTSVSNPLGSNNGWGFGWDDVTIYKVGVNYAHSNKWTFRAGFNYAELPYDDDQALFNVLAPAVVEQHITAGFTYAPDASSEISATYMHALRNEVDYTYNGSGGFTGFSFSADQAMQQNALEISYAKKF